MKNFLVNTNESFFSYSEDEKEIEIIFFPLGHTQNKLSFTITSSDKSGKHKELLSLLNSIKIFPKKINNDFIKELYEKNKKIKISLSLKNNYKRKNKVETIIL